LKGSTLPSSMAAVFASKFSPPDRNGCPHPNPGGKVRRLPEVGAVGALTPGEGLR
jgi:hypothetical protein